MEQEKSELYGTIERIESTLRETETERDRLKADLADVQERRRLSESEGQRLMQERLDEKDGRIRQLEATVNSLREDIQ